LSAFIYSRRVENVWEQHSNTANDRFSCLCRSPFAAAALTLSQTVLVFDWFLEQRLSLIDHKGM